MCNSSDPFGLAPDSTNGADSTSKAHDSATAKHNAAVSTCRADAGKFGVSLLMNVTGLSLVKYLKAAADVVRVGRVLGTASAGAFENAGGAFAAQAMYTPSAMALHSGLATGGTNYHFGGAAGFAYTVAKALPAVGAGLELGEAIHSCSNTGTP